MQRPRYSAITPLAWLFTIPFLIWAVVRVLGWEHGWPWVQLMAFTPYAAAGSVVVAVFALVTRRWVPAVVALVAAVSLVAVVAPRAFSDGGRTAAGQPLRVLTVNLMGGSVDERALVALVRRLDVDVLALQELTPAGDADLRAADLHRYLPYAASFPLPGVSGSAVLSRHPLTATAHRPLRGGAVQAQATLDVPGARPVEVESAHPAAPWGRPGMANWYRDLRAQPPATVDGHLRILLGDFNATLDHVALRRLVNSGYRDAAEVSGTGLRTSWPSQGQRLMAPVTLDHVLADRRIGVAEARPYLIAGTDHRAVYAELVIPRP
ncbi:endonuclease/exonuclease/phosphatase family protein [Virgisporangium aurantiacum]|uniref:endonuclease/exonuclease/phosphatase family protein n=1 Tax=Virgisporangium aurantiacum TaxID=175570 RepID=UPI0035712BC3